MLRLTKPPAVVQRALFGPIAAIAHRRGCHPLSAAMHGRSCPAWIPPPDDATLERLVARRASATDAR